jgi:hypothetical protein
MCSSERTTHPVCQSVIAFSYPSLVQRPSLTPSPPFQALAASTPTCFTTAPAAPACSLTLPRPALALTNCNHSSSTCGCGQAVHGPGGQRAASHNWRVPQEGGKRWIGVGRLAAGLLSAVCVLVSAQETPGSIRPNVEVFQQEKRHLVLALTRWFHNFPSFASAITAQTTSSMQASLSSRAVIARRPTAAAPRQVRACGLSPAHCPPSPPMAAISTWTGGQGVRSSGWWAGCWCNPWPSLRPSRAPPRRSAGPPGFQAGGAGLQGHPEDPFRRAGVCALRVALLRGPGPLYAAAMIRWQHPSRGQPPQPLSEAGRPCTTPI